MMREADLWAIDFFRREEESLGNRPTSQVDADSKQTEVCWGKGKDSPF